MKRHIVAALLLGFGLVILALFVPGLAAGEDVTLELTVVDQNGNTLSGVEVTVEWEDGSDTRATLPDGTVAFGVPAGADVEVTISHAAYVRNFPHTIENVTVPDGQNRVNEEIDVSLSGTLELVVEEDGDPVDGVSVTVIDQDEQRALLAAPRGASTFRPSMGEEAIQEFETDEDGRLVFQRLEQRDYLVITAKPGYLNSETVTTLSGNNHSQTIAIETARVRVDFSVRDDYFDPAEPVENAQIRIPERGITLETFSDGGQDQRLPVNSEYEIEVTKEGYHTVQRTLAVQEEAVDFNVTIQRTPLLSLDLLNEQVITGQTTRVTVTNAYGEPVEGATVSLDGSEVGSTDATGSADVQIEEAGEFTITASHESLEDSATIEAFDPDDDDIPEDIEGQVDDTDDDVEDENDADADDDGSGFSVLIGLLALVAAALVGLHSTTVTSRDDR